ncbi:MAG: hypothetical protein JNL74_13000, partial [Fibrobacteres bacterium]|nr:hypothetical protein [Fibrobacterota bacterium]
MKIYILMILLSVSVSLFSAVSFVRQPSIEKVGDSFKVVFELSEYSDVEVAVVDTVSDVILCHLAAGKLGPKAPPPLVINSLRQELFWNGRDDYRNTVQVTTSLSVRVRVGMSAKIDRIAGGDPYAFFTREMTAGNHSVWTIAGIEGKSDGSVYVYGSSNQMGVYTIRKYDSDGNYIKTVFPFPSGFPSAKVAAWGVNVRPDGTYSPKVAWGNSWPIYTTTPINMMSGFGPQP